MFVSLWTILQVFLAALGHQKKKKKNLTISIHPCLHLSHCSMPNTHALGDASQSASQSLEVADILLLQEKAKSMAQTEHKKHKASSALCSATISKPPNSSSSSDDDAVPAQDQSSMCQSATAMPTSIPDPHGTVVQPDSGSPSGSPPHSPSRLLHKPKKHKKPMVTSDSDSSSSDLQPPKCRSKKAKCASTKTSTEKSFRSSSNHELIQHLETLYAHLPTRCQKQQRKSPLHCQKVILLLPLTNIYLNTSSN